MSAENYDAMSTDELFDAFLSHNATYHRMKRVCGIIYWHLKQKLGLHPGAGGNNNKFKGPTIAGELRKKGCSRHLISRSSTFAKVYNRVKDGLMTEEEYFAISWEKALELNASNPTGRTIPRTQKSAEPTLQVFTESFEDIPKSAQTVNEALATAQEWILEARSRLPANQKTWDETISSILRYLGELRFQITEATPKARKSVAA